MCGIIGYLGTDDFKEFVLTGLSLIQNRGYDSVGISYNVNNNIITHKKASTNTHNSLSIVSDIVKKDVSASNVAIGHTRWATHGGKTDFNAHPHSDANNQITLAHNGIIENYLEIKKELQEEGYNFMSQTDTEVIVALLSKNYQELNDMKLAIKKTTSRLRGTWALVIMLKDESNKLWLTRNGSPILLGLQDNYAIVASEQSGFGNYINKFIPIKDHNIIELFLSDGIVGTTMLFNETNIITKTDITLNTTPEPYKHWMEKEIYTQGQCVMSAINNGGRIISDDMVKLGGLEYYKETLLNLDHLILLGCGTSYNAAFWSISLFKQFSKFQSVQVIDGAEFEEQDLPKSDKVGLVFLSQSGETRDLIRCLDIAKKHSLLTIGIVNVVDSFIARETDCGIYLNAGQEVAVASTKSFTNQCIVLSLLCTWFSMEDERTTSIRKQIINDIRILPIQIESVLNNNIDKIVELIDISSSCFLLGKGSNQAIANEGALKLKEIAYMHAEGFSSSALKHGPFALIVDNLPIFIIDTNYTHHDKNINAYNELKARGANVHLISSIDKTDMPVPENNTFGGILGNIYFELISY